MTLQIAKPFDTGMPVRPTRAGFFVGRLVLIVLIAGSLAGAVNAHAIGMPSLGPASEPWHIAADDLSFDNQTGEYLARGDVLITKGDRRLTADFVRFNHQTMQVTAVGSIVLSTGRDVITCHRLEIDLGSEKGTVYEGTLFIQTNHFYITGQRIEKIGPGTYKARDVSVTTCDGQTPDWKLTARDLDITIEGYGIAKHAALWTKKVPVLYTPWFAFPVKLERQTGLLPPQMGYGTRKGAEFIQPLFWAINQSSDITFYGQYMQKRGVKAGGEYRYILDRASKGTVMLDGFEDRQVDDGSPEATRDWGYDEDDDDRPNRDRYWFRMKHDQALPGEFKSQLDLDIVSDQDYLREFRTGYMGFDDTREYYMKNFNREIDEYNDTVRINRVNAGRTWMRASLNAELRYYDDIIKRRWEAQDDTLHKLPHVGFSMIQQSLGSRHLYLDFDSEYTHYYRQIGTRGHRLDLYPRAYLPFRFFDRVTLQPSVGLRETVWSIDEFESGVDDPDRIQNRTLYDIGVNLSTEFFATWNTKIRSVDRLKHSVRPQILYEYIPNNSQANIPAFDPAGAIAERNRLTYSLTNVLITRSQPVQAPAADTGTDPPFKEIDAFIFRPVCRFKLEQSYDTNEANADNPLEWANPDERQPFSPVYGEIEIDPFKFLTLKADANWSQYENEFLTHNIATRITDVRGDYLHAEHRYTQGAIQSFYTNVKLKLFEPLSGYGDYERNLLDGVNIRTTIGLLYEAQCWSTDFRYAAEPGYSSFEFVISLYGLGGIGN